MTATMEKCALEPKTFDHLKGLDGISDETIEQHQKLYQGYVTNLGKLMEKLQTLEAGSPEWAELKRRLGFEGNGVVLHELYFNNMKPNGGPLSPDSPLYKKIVEQFGSYEKWEADFKATGMMRGIGWAILYQCSCTGMLMNIWATDHENGHPSAGLPILVLDVWEHAYAVDHKPTGRKAYIDAFFKNVNWEAAAERLK